MSYSNNITLYTLGGFQEKLGDTFVEFAMYFRSS